MQTFESNSWHAAFVITGEEEKVRERLMYRLKDSNIRIIVPKRKLRERKNGIWETRIRTLFPGYILLNGDIGRDEYKAFINVPGLISVLKDKSGLLRITEEEITVLSRLICNNDVIGPSSVFLEGGRVVVIDGPLLGLEGLIESIDRRKGRAKVRLNFIGEARLIELSISMVQTS